MTTPRTFNVSPRYVLTNARGGEFLLGADRTPLYHRRARDKRGETADATMPIPKAVAIRDLWPDGVSPTNDPAAGYAVREIMRRWRLWPEG